jgi:glyoxylate carboligase
MIENGWQENIYFKSYICIILYMILADQYAVTYNTLHVVTNNCYLGILKDY